MMPLRIYVIIIAINDKLCWKMASTHAVCEDITAKSTLFEIQSWDLSYQYVVWCENMLPLQMDCIQMCLQDH